MSSRRPRSRFAAPLVVTLAMAPACVVRSGSPPPSGGGVVTHDRRTGGSTPAPTPIVNPPRPLDPGASGSPPVEQVPPRQPDPATDVVQAGPTQQTPQPPTTWSVHQEASDRSCYATLDVRCPPAPSTCNPPSARKLASCPDGVSPTTALKIQELSPGSCFVVHPTPACPAGTTCNPPRPTSIACPR